MKWDGHDVQASGPASIVLHNLGEEIKKFLFVFYNLICKLEGYTLYIY